MTGVVGRKGTDHADAYLSIPMAQSVASRRDLLPGWNRHQPSRPEHDSCAAASRVMACPTFAIVQILIQLDHVDDEMPRRARARTAGSAIASSLGSSRKLSAVSRCPLPQRLGISARGTWRRSLLD